MYVFLNFISYKSMIRPVYFLKLSGSMECRQLENKSGPKCSTFRGRQVLVPQSYQRSAMSREMLQAAALYIQDQARAESTKVSQDSRVRTFFTFTRLFDIREFPPDGPTMVLFATWLTLTSVSTPGSLKQYFSSRHEKNR